MAASAFAGGPSGSLDRVTKRMAGIRAAQDARRAPEAVVFWMVIWHQGRATQGDPPPAEYPVSQVATLCARLLSSAPMVIIANMTGTSTNA